MKKRINIQCMLLAFVTIVSAMAISTFVFYNILKREVLGDMRNYVDIFIGADAWGMVSDPDAMMVISELHLLMLRDMRLWIILLK